MAKLYFTHGPMGSMKTTQLLATAHNYEAHGSKILVAKPSVDTKGDRHVISRIGVSREVDFLAAPDMDVQAEVLRRRESIGRIGALLIDEAQFMTEEQVDQAYALAVVNGIAVMAFGLRTDFRTRSFPGSRRLLEIAHELRESRTMCEHGDGCVHRAEFNARRKGGVFVGEGEQVEIDGIADITYASLCGPHYIENVGPVAVPTDVAPMLGQAVA
jgi:thymidine kinase